MGGQIACAGGLVAGIKADGADEIEVYAKSVTNVLATVIRIIEIISVAANVGQAPNLDPVDVPFGSRKEIPVIIGNRDGLQRAQIRAWDEDVVRIIPLHHIREVGIDLGR